MAAVVDSIRELPGRAIAFGKRMTNRPVRVRHRSAVDVHQKSSRQKAPKGVAAGIQVRNGIWHPTVRPEALVLLTDNIWVVGAAVDRVNEEVIKGGWDWNPRYGAKCLRCGTEYDVKPEECDSSGCFSEEFSEPDRGVLKTIDAFFDRPNWDDETGRIVKSFKDILKDWAYYAQVISDYHGEIVWGDDGMPSQIWPMNSEFMRRVADPSIEVGKLFCPQCLKEAGARGATYKDKDATCPTHGVKLQKSTWVQLDEFQNIKAVWSARDVIHDQARARGYRLYGRSKVLRCWAMGQIVRWQELYQWAAYSGNKAPDAIVTVEGLDQSEVNQMIDELEKFKEEHPQYKELIWIGMGREGGTNVNVQHVLGKLVDMDTVALAKHYTEAVAINLGVSLTMMGVQEAGKLGRPEELLQVSYDTIEEMQTQLNEFVNNQIVPLFEGVSDQWEWKLNPPAPEDEERKSREALGWVQVVHALKQNGVRARLDPNYDFDWPIEILEDTGDLPPPPQPFGGQPGQGGGGGGFGQQQPGSAPKPFAGVENPEKPDLPDAKAEPELGRGDPRKEEAIRRRLAAATTDEEREILISELYDLLSQRARAEMLPRPRSPLYTKKKANLSPRNIPGKHAAEGIRGFEEKFLALLNRRYDTAIRQLKRERKRSLNVAEARLAMRHVIDGLRDEFVRLGTENIRDAYLIGLRSEAEKGMPMTAFEGHDEAIVQWLQQNPEALAGSLSTVVDDVEGAIGAELRESFARGVDVATAVNRLEGVLDAKRHQIENIVRTQTTSIVNRARVAQWEKHADPNEKIYEWVLANHPDGDHRTCPSCKAIANGGTADIWGREVQVHGNPYTLPELTALLPHMTAHGRDRCAIVRNPGLRMG